MPASSGWITLTRPVGTILPCAVAMMSIWPRQAHAMAISRKAMMDAAMARPTGDAGVSVISSAAGRKSRSSRPSLLPRHGRTGAPLALADFMEARLQPVEIGVAPIAAHQFVVTAILDQAPPLQGQDPIGAPHRP